ncbi:putative two-component system response regulator [Alkalispirochaeta americana]|uniref:Putative two-component system response regulator n=1 Tax=Alkalispirochaeta americana TaxID=159291 RepID=A0A1N6WWS5_9SPIO|nr:HD domain-containing phosphohydrolase [Alkalispirochaeta americana]SIQ94470.1 putative two-component system response regulator [Alkalispirochaeta americana]
MDALIRSARILMVDDEFTNLQVLRKMLESQGYFNLTGVQDSRQVVELYQEIRPDLVLLDLNMPHRDGYGVMEDLQSLDVAVRAPIVVLTARAGRDSLLQAFQCGARDYIMKPLDMAELFARVRTTLEAHLAHKMLHAQKETLDWMVQARTDDLLRTRMQVIHRLGRAAEYRDNETGQHVLRVSHGAALLARHAGWGETDCEMLLEAAPMHDVGKIGIPDKILLKPGALTAGEWKIMKRHTLIGADLLSGEDNELFHLAREIALAHHEKWDGSGYPRGLAGESIPLSARLVAVVDVFDALTSVRPYKDAWSVEAATRLIRDESGRHFDPDLVALFDRLLPEICEIRQRFADQNNHSEVHRYEST